MIRELARHWEHNAKGRLTHNLIQIRLDLESAARLAALGEMYPKRQPRELLGELIGAALEELEASLPYVKGSQVVAAFDMEQATASSSSKINSPSSSNDYFEFSPSTLGSRSK